MSTRQQITDSSIINRLTLRKTKTGQRIRTPLRDADSSYVASVLSVVYLTGRVFVLMVIFVLGTVGGSKILSPNVPDPLAPYEAIMPGKSDEALKTSRYQPAPISAYDQNGVQYYVTEPKDSVIDKIVVGSRSGTIQRVTFFLNRLQLGYLVLRLGWPDTVNINPQRYTARWRSGVVATGNTMGEFGYRTPVQILSIE